MSARWYVRHARHLADPAGAAAVRIALERAAGQRGRRLTATAKDAVRQRVRPTRPRMRAVVLSPGGRLTFRAVPAPPPPGALGAVVHPLATATCDMDRPIACGHTGFAAPMQFGHECVAEVLSVGSDVERVRPGDRVVVPFQINCGDCAMCRAGLTANCLAVPPVSMYGFGITGGHWGGAFADEVAVPFADGMLVPFPDGLDPVAAASVADNVSDAYRHVGPHLPALRERGAGAGVTIVAATSRRSPFTHSVPLYTALIAQALGVPEVLLVDARPRVRAEAAALGIEAVAPKHARGAALVADISASPPGLALALSLTAPDGVCSSSGSLHARTRIPTMAMYGRNVTLHFARAHARALIPEVLDLMTTGRLAPERVTTTVAPMDDAPAALTEHMRAASAKTIITA